MTDSKSIVLAKLSQAIDSAYDLSSRGLPGFPRAEELARYYQRKNREGNNHEGENREGKNREGENREREKAIDDLIKWQVMGAGASGLITGLPGITTAALTIPANLFSVIAIQLRMIEAIAILRGYDAKSNRGLIIACLAGSAVADVLKKAGVKIGSKLTAQAIGKISGAMLIKINQSLGFRLLTKAGTAGTVNLTKLIPIVGGVVSGGFDAGTTHLIARAAKKVFVHIPAEDLPSG